MVYFPEGVFRHITDYMLDPYKEVEIPVDEFVDYCLENFPNNFKDKFRSRYAPDELLVVHLKWSPDRDRMGWSNLSFRFEIVLKKQQETLKLADTINYNTSSAFALWLCDSEFFFDESEDIS